MDDINPYGYLTGDSGQLIRLLPAYEPAGAEHRCGAAALGLYVRGAVQVFPDDDALPLQHFLATRLLLDQKVFVKPLYGAEGRRVRAITRTSTGFRMDGQDVSVAESRGWIEEQKRPMLFERGVAQHADQAALNPEATNTIRVLTMPDVTSRLKFMEYVGWGIIISPTGPVSLEANINSGMNVLQVHGPLLADPRVRAYYAKRGVI